MNAKKFYLLIGIVLMVGFLPQGSVSADMGPKPHLDFDIVQDGLEPELTMVSWSLINCENSECTKMGEIIPVDSFDCEDFSCYAGVYYGIQHKYFKMEITFSDGITRESNVFTNRYFESKYRVTIQSDSLLVKELRGSNAKSYVLILAIFGVYFFYPATILIVVLAAFVVTILAVVKKDGIERALKRFGKVILWALMVDLIFTGLVLSASTFILTLTIEMTLTLAYWRYLKLPDKRLFYGVFLANVFTHPVLVFIQAVDIYPYSMSNLMIAESVIWVVETIIVYYTQKKGLSFKNILALAFILNAASFGIGLLLPI